MMHSGRFPKEPTLKEEKLCEVIVPQKAFNYMYSGDFTPRRPN